MLDKRKKLSLFYILIGCFFVALLAEIFLFNFRALEARTFSIISPSEYEQTYSSNATVQTYNSTNRIKTITFGAEGDCYIEMTGLNQILSNIYLNVTDSDVTVNEVNVVLYARDEGNSLYYELPVSTIKRDSISSHYIKLNLSGKAHALRINFENANGKTLQFDEIQFNVKRPFLFSAKRVFLLFVSFLALYCMRPNSKIYKTTYNPVKKIQKLFFLCLVTLEIVCSYQIARYNPDYVKPIWQHHTQYAELAKSITEGHLYLDEEPSDSLKAMDNPYDYELRIHEGIPCAWDEAYYNGHYYVYFGIVPVFIFYLPYYVFTGKAFPTWWGIIIVQTIILIGILFLIHAVARRYFKEISLGVFVLMNLSLVLGSGVAVTAVNAIFYQLPIAMGIAFTIWGLYFWISASEKSCWKMIAGSVCMALVAGCRPQLLLGSFFAIPLFLPQLWRKFKSGEAIKAMWQLIKLLIPFLVFAAFIMWYNAARFSSPFDFGANYNLTTNDMTHRGFHIDRLPLGIYMYLLQPPCFTTAFPFITFSPTEIHYQGITIMEKMYAGQLWLNPLLFGLFFLRKIRSILKEKKLYIITVFCILSGIILVCLDTQMAGILFRYWCDFGFFFSFASVIIVLTIEEAFQKSTGHVEVNRVKQMYFRKLLCMCTLISLILWILTLLCIFNTVH